MIRQPVVVGQFYPAGVMQLRKSIEECFLHPIGPGKLPPERKAGGEDGLFGLVVPHAGYSASGPVAAHAYFRLAQADFDWVMILGTNHTGLGKLYAYMTQGAWHTPLGDVSLASDKAGFLRQIPHLEEDSLAHAREHSIEVQLPFLQFIRPQTPVIPLSLSGNKLDPLKEIGSELGALLQGEKVIVLASTDLSHYHDLKTAEKLDQIALEAILAMNSDLLWQRVQQVPISMCGYAPVIVLIEAAKKLGANRVELLKYANSGHTTGFTSQVVGYASISFCRSQSS